MARSVRKIDGVWVGVLVSAAVHLTAAGVLLSADPSEDLLRASAARDQTPPRDEEREQTRLGIARSDRVTVNWLGFADPTPHKGLPSEIEQAALSMAPVGVPTENPSPAEADRPEPLTETPAEPAETETAEATEEATEAVAEARPEPSPSEAIEPTERAVAEAAPVAPETIEAAPDSDAPGLVGPVVERPEPVPLLEVVPEATEAEATGERPEKQNEQADVAQPAEDRPTEPTEPTEPSESKEPAEPAEPEAGGGPSGADDLPGIRSDRESTPTAELPAVTIDDWGRPAAGEGIEITPRRPDWGPTLASLARPKSPTVIIDFQRDGTVRRVTFAKEKDKTLSTGHAEADRVLLNSVYNWRAKGEKIESLAKEGPGSVFRIRIFIRIRL